MVVRATVSLDGCVEEVVFTMPLSESLSNQIKGKKASQISSKEMVDVYTEVLSVVKDEYLNIALSLQEDFEDE